MNAPYTAWRRSYLSSAKARSSLARCSSSNVASSSTGKSKAEGGSARLANSAKTAVRRRSPKPAMTIMWVIGGHSRGSFTTGTGTCMTVAAWTGIMPACIMTCWPPRLVVMGWAASGTVCGVTAAGAAATTGLCAAGTAAACAGAGDAAASGGCITGATGAMPSTGGGGVGRAPAGAVCAGGPGMGGAMAGAVSNSSHGSSSGGGRGAGGGIIRKESIRMPYHPCSDFTRSLRPSWHTSRPLRPQSERLPQRPRTTSKSRQAR